MMIAANCTLRDCTPWLPLPQYCWLLSQIEAWQASDCAQLCTNFEQLQGLYIAVVMPKLTPCIMQQGMQVF